MSNNPVGVGIKHVYIKVNGSQISDQLQDNLVSVEVEDTLYYPSMFTIRYFDEKLEFEASFKIGDPIIIEMGGSSDKGVIMNGEVTSIESEFGRDFHAHYTIRGFDKRHRLNRETKTQNHLQVKHSDLVQSIASAAGLSPQIDQTTTVYESVIQSNLTDLEFLNELAKINGYNVWMQNGKLYFKKHEMTSPITHEWGKTLFEFSPRVSAAKQVNEVVVRGWDAQTKREIVGTARSGGTAATIGGFPSGGGSVAQQSFASAAKRIEVRRNVVNQGDANNIAQAILDTISKSFIEATGVLQGDHRLVAGKTIKLQNLGTRFNGDYFLTSVRHVYEDGAYETHFSVEGARPQGISDLVGESKISDSGINQWIGAYIALVTNLNDPNNQGRVKVKFPWLNSEMESHWARIAMPGAGNTRGIMWMPEVNDEVLVVFEHGDLNRPFIVGGLWNGQDAVPDTTAVNNGAIDKRLFKTRTGHTIELVESSSVSMIHIFDGQNKTMLKLDGTNQKVQITSTGDVEIEAQGNINITASSAINLKATQDFSIKGQNVNITANAAVTVKGSTTAELSASGATTVKGSVVNIN